MFKIPQEMIENYVLRRRDDINTLAESLKLGSVRNFNRIGHQLAGSARSFGFEDLERIGQQMEALEESKLQTEGEKLLAHFQKWSELNSKLAEPMA